jgi:hydroxyacylglutathione hydrolase
MNIHKIVVGQMAENCYIVTDSDEVIIIDPGDDAEHISDVLARLNVIPSIIIATHGHFDHIMAAFALQMAYKIPFVMHGADAFLVRNMAMSAKHFLGLTTVDPPPNINKYIQDGDTIASLTVLHTPGHTPGSVSLVGDGVIFTGDTIFADGAVGRTDFSYSSAADLKTSIQKILQLPKNTIMYPGHGEETRVQYAYDAQTRSY